MPLLTEKSQSDQKFKTTSALVCQLKQNDQDFEWYPTTKEILKKVAFDIKMIGDDHFSLLDIGAGNGQTFTIIHDFINKIDDEGRDSHSIKKYAIEKSKILIDNMPEDIFIVGSDFTHQTLIDKKVDVIFCNPPYKEYIFWMEKIIKEANSKYIYLVVPQRWKEVASIIKVIKERTEKEDGFKILGQFDFNDSEFRQARAKVEIIKIKLDAGRYSRSLKTDPFDIWFDENFKIQADKSKYESEFEVNRTKKEDLKNLVQGQNLMERLEELYLEDMNNLFKTYKSLEGLDYQLLKELEVNLESVKEALKMKIEGLKNLYWHELFDNLESLTDRLTSASRKKLLETLNEHTHIDYSSNNAYAVVLWAIKNANKYLNSQLAEIYRKLSEPDAVRNYKSNKNIIKDTWRYCQGDVTHYTLDYRIVTRQYNCFDNSGYRSYEHPNGLAKSVHDFINDICVIGKNLAFSVNESSYSFEWSPGQEKSFHCLYNGKHEIFMKARAYKNGNVHLKLNQEFMKAFNIEASRINGWVKFPDDLVEETDLSKKDITKHYGNNKQFKHIKLLEC